MTAMNIFAVASRILSRSPVPLCASPSPLMIVRSMTGYKAGKHVNRGRMTSREGN